MSTNKQAIEVSAKQINVEYKMARSSIVDSANHILNVGRMLTEVKAKLSHGKFIPWVEAECDFSRRAASSMMKVVNGQPASHLTEEDALPLT